MTKSSLSGETGLKYGNKEQRDLPVRLKCVLIKSDCWIKSVLTSEFCIAFYSMDQNKVSVTGIDDCWYVRVIVHIFIEGFGKDLFPSRVWTRCRISNYRFRQFLLYLYVTQSLSK